MELVCGTCRQFVRQRQHQNDLCSAWGNPTTIKRAACEFWMPKGGVLFEINNKDKVRNKD
nr:hypothetical protein [Vibrio hangzhouensis]